MTNEEINEICQKYEITNYTINDNGTIDVNGDVDLFDYDLEHLPLLFNKVTGYFDCQHNYLTTLYGAPKWVGDRFNCGGRNYLGNLKSSPEYVGGDFICDKCQLTSLEGGPKEVGGFYGCNDNKLTNLIGAPKLVGGAFVCEHNELTSLSGSPDKVGGNYYCGNNDIKDLDRFNTEFLGKFYCERTPIAAFLSTMNKVWENAEYSEVKAFKSFKVLKDGKVSLKRLKYFNHVFPQRTSDWDLIDKYYTIVD